MRLQPSITGLITWLEKQPTKKRYNYADPCTCMAAQYNASIGREYSFDGANPYGTLDQQLEWIARPLNPQSIIGTFGVALRRARTFQKER